MAYSDELRPKENWSLSSSIGVITIGQPALNTKLKFKHPLPHQKHVKSTKTLLYFSPGPSSFKQEG